jgi:hypothetical protein
MWTPIHSGQRTTMGLLLPSAGVDVGGVNAMGGGASAGGSVTQPRVVARAWSVPTEATGRGEFAGAMTIDLVPVARRDGLRTPGFGGLGVGGLGGEEDDPAPGTLGSMGLAMSGQRITPTVRLGQVLIIAPLLTREDPVVEVDGGAGTPEMPRAGEVVRQGDAARSAGPGGAGVGGGRSVVAGATGPALGPRSEPPLTLGELLLTDARVSPSGASGSSRAARSVQLIVLVPIGPASDTPPSPGR